MTRRHLDPEIYKIFVHIRDFYAKSINRQHKLRVGSSNTDSQIVKRRQILRLIPYVLSSWSAIAYAQNVENSNVEERFNRAAAKHKKEFKNLLARRGRPLIHLLNTSAASIADLLAIRQEAGDYYGEILYPEKTAVLFYAHENRDLQTWLVTEHGIQAYTTQHISKQTISEAILNLKIALNIDPLQRSRTPHKRGSVAITFPNRTSTKILLNDAITNLTEILLPTSIANKLETVHHLIVVPILAIGTVPYAILQPFQDGSFLIDKMSVSISANLFDLGDPVFSRSVSSSPLIVGNPYLPDSPDWSVPPLPGAEQEAQSVAEIINAVPLIRKKATKEKILSKLGEASLLYFATHGVASTHDPLNGSFLMLSAQKIEQGWLTAKEIQGFLLRANMAVLSACQTGLGQAHDAGVIGLARAFQLAGVPRVVMSLWNVDDQATSELMQAFMTHIDNLVMPSEALRQAMLEVRRKYPNLSHWASFVLFGTPR